MEEKKYIATEDTQLNIRDLVEKIANALSGFSNSDLSDHNESTEAHQDIREAITAAIQEAIDEVTAHNTSQEAHQDIREAIENIDLSDYATKEDLNNSISGNHNHDGIYQPIGDYAESSHTHSEYATISSPTFTGNVTADNLTVTTKLSIPGGEIYIA